MERQTDRQTDRQRDRDRETEGQTEKDKQTNSRTDKRTDIKTNECCRHLAFSPNVTEKIQLPTRQINVIYATSHITL